MGANRSVWKAQTTKQYGLDDYALAARSPPNIQSCTVVHHCMGTHGSMSRRPHSVVRRSSFVVRCSLFVVRCSSFVVRRSSFIDLRPSIIACRSSISSTQTVNRLARSPPEVVFGWDMVTGQWLTACDTVRASLDRLWS